MRILLAEDDAMIAHSIRTSLQVGGYVVDLVADGRLVNDVVLSEHFDLLSLDPGLPHRSELEILGSIRAGKLEIFVIIIAVRDEAEDKVTGLNLGVDDYPAKLFSSKQLAARIRSPLRRSCGQVKPDPKIEDVWFSQRDHQVTDSGQVVFKVNRSVLKGSNRQLRQRVLIIKDTVYGLRLFCKQSGFWLLGTTAHVYPVSDCCTSDGARP